MSTQLILYPQTYKGQHSSNFTGVSNQYLQDGINFTSINTSTSITISGTATDVLVAQPPTIVNTWYRSREFAGQSYPLQISSNLVLYALAGASKSSTYVYQKLSNEYAINIISAEL